VREYVGYASECPGGQYFRPVPAGRRPAAQSHPRDVLATDSISPKAGGALGGSPEGWQPPAVAGARTGEDGRGRPSSGDRRDSGGPREAEAWLRPGSGWRDIRAPARAAAGIVVAHIRWCGMERGPGERRQGAGDDLASRPGSAWRQAARRRTTLRTRWPRHSGTRKESAPPDKALTCTDTVTDPVRRNWQAVLPSVEHDRGDWVRGSADRGTRFQRSGTRLHGSGTTSTATVTRSAGSGYHDPPVAPD
jgi:hypothetical protein